MRKLMLVLVASALFPAAALANNHPGKHHQVSRGASPSQLTAKNSAWLCKSLQTQDRTAFAKSFGTNGNLRNAYGKCVSGHARGTHLHGSTFTLHNVTLTSTGTVTSAGAANCQTTTQGCTITSTGTVNGVVGGTYSTTWTILWTQATSNNQGGYCAPASGTTTLTFPVVGTLTKSEQGTVCEVGATGTNVEHTLNGGTFTVTSGTGMLTGATGSGTVSFDQKPGATNSMGGAVTGSETFSDLTITLQ